MQFLFSPIWGRWSDRIGRKPIILIGLMGSCLSYLMLAVAASLPLVFLARIIGGIAGANIPDRAGVHRGRDDAGESREGHGPGRRGLRPGLHLRPGARRRAEPDWSVDADVVRVGAVSAPTSSPPGACCRNRARPRRDAETLGRLAAFRRAVGHPQLLLLLALYFVVTVSFSGFEATFALFTRTPVRRSPPPPSDSCSRSSASSCRWCRASWWDRVVKRVGEARLITGGDVADRRQPRTGAVVRDRAALLVALGMLAAGMGFNGPSLSSMVSKLSDPNDQGGILGLASSLASLGRVIGPAWGGFLFDRFGMTMPYLSAAAIMMVAFAAAVAWIARCTSSRSTRLTRARSPATATGPTSFPATEPVLIDAGVGQPSHLEALTGAMPAGPSHVVVTHAHSDHASGAPAIAARWPSARFAKYPWPDRRP